MIVFTFDKRLKNDKMAFQLPISRDLFGFLS